MGELEIKILGYEIFFWNGKQNELGLRIFYKDNFPFGEGMKADMSAYHYPVRHHYHDNIYLRFMRNRKRRSEIEKLSKIVQVGQKVVNGEIVEDEENPFVTKEKIDLFFEEMKYIHIEGWNLLHVQFSPTKELELDMFCAGYEFTDWLLSLSMKEEARHKLKTKGPFVLKDFKYYISESGIEILGYRGMEDRKEYPYFCKKIEELMLQVVESKEFKTWRLRKLLE